MLGGELSPEGVEGFDMLAGLLVKFGAQFLLEQPCKISSVFPENGQFFPMEVENLAFVACGGICFRTEGPMVRWCVTAGHYHSVGRCSCYLARASLPYGPHLSPGSQVQGAPDGPVPMCGMVGARVFLAVFAFVQLFCLDSEIYCGIPMTPTTEAVWRQGKGSKGMVKGSS